MSFQAEARATSTENLSSDQADATPRSSSRPSEDPVLAAVRRAPRMSPETAALCRALVTEAKSDPHDPNAWLTEEQLMARLALGRRDRE